MGLRGRIAFLSLAVASLWAVTAPGLGGARAGDADPTPPLPPQVEPLVRDFMAARTDGTSVIIPGLSVAIGRDGALLYAAGFGEADAHRPATAQSVYMVGSITKQFTAAAVLRLIERGAKPRQGGAVVTQETPVADVLRIADAWRIEDGPPITIAHLLSMTSSLPNFTRRPPQSLDPWGAVPAGMLLGHLKEFRPSGFPGSFEYSNTSYFLLSELIEQLAVDGVTRNYHQVLKDELFMPLGLDSTGFAGDRAVDARLAAPHYQRRPAFAQPDWLKGSGDVASSVLDILRWNTALIEGQALSAPMRDLMLSDAARVDVWTYYGAGWFIIHKDGIDRYFHSGTVPGYTSFNLIVRRASPARWVSVTVLTNSDGVTGLDELADKLAELALADQ
jgi:CubicO group peptidase (beta-lactamase class C family)